MTGMTDYSADNWASYIVGKAAMPTLPVAYMALFVVAGVDAGTGFTEPTGNGYARVATTGASWNAASGSGPSTITNASAVSFPAATGGGSGFGTIVAIGFYDALTGGNLLVWDWHGNFPWQPVSISLASPGVFTAHAHGLSVADSIVYSTEFMGTAPTFSQSNLSGILTVAHAATDTFDVTNAATAVNTSATGNGAFRKITQQQIPSGVTATFAAGAFTLSVA